MILNDIHVEPVDISLIKKYKTVDVPCVHSAIENIQKSLQRYVKFSGMDSRYCDMINDLLDEAENWCLRVEVLYNKAEIHSINTSKGDTADVGVFSDNAKVTVYEFLEAAEIAYLIDLEFEEPLDNHEKLLSLLEDSYSLCNVHNAQVNVHGIRGIRDDVEPGIAEELLIDLEIDFEELERTMFQPRIQTPEKVGYLESLEEKLLIDMSPAELEELKFQSGTQTPDKVGYSENLEEDSIILETCRLRDGPDLRISTNLDDLPGIRGDNSELSGPLEINESKLGIIFETDNVHFKNLHQKAKLCRLFVINNSKFSLFNSSDCAQKLICWKKK